MTIYGAKSDLHGGAGKTNTVVQQEIMEQARYAIMGVRAQAFNQAPFAESAEAVGMVR